MFAMANSYIEQVKFVGLGANGVGKQQQVALQPRHLLAGILEADTGTRHDDFVSVCMDDDGWEGKGVPGGAIVIMKKRKSR